MERIDPSQRLWAQPIAESIPKNSNLYIALDIDVMDPAVVPSVIGPAPGGFSYWQIIEILEAAAKQPKVASHFHATRVRFGHFGVIHAPPRE
jgi:arginase family enzyme